MDIYDRNSVEMIQQFIGTLKNKIENLEKEMDCYPDGKLRVTSSKGYLQYRISSRNLNTIETIKKNKWNIIYDNKDKKSRCVSAYIPKENLDFAEKLVRREMLENEYIALNKILRLIESGMKHNRNYLENSVVADEKIRINNQRNRDIEKRYEKWMKQEYIKNPAPLYNTLETKNHIIVRSKSEQAIANLLIDYKIPFLYEPLLVANGNQHYPDFVIINPFTKKAYIWEHNGSMDDVHYIYKVEKRFRDYSIEGFVLGDDLIFTSETLSRPLNYNDIMNNILRIINDPGDKRNEKWDMRKWDKIVHDLS